MPVAKQHLVQLVLGARHLPDRERIAAFIGDAATAFAGNAFPVTSAGTVRHVWANRAFEFRCLGVSAVGLPALLDAVAALDGAAPLHLHILRSGPHTLCVYTAEPDNAVMGAVLGAVLHGQPGFPLPENRPPPRRGRDRYSGRQLDLFAVP